jgi:protein-disulfide isomerase
MKKIKSVLIILVFLPWFSFAKEKIYEYQQFLTDNELSPLIRSTEEISIDLLEFSSFSCSHCAAFHNETLQELKESDVFKHINYYIIDYPLNQAAFYASIVANCDPSIRSMYSDATYSNYDVWTKAESGEQIIEMLNSYGLQFGLEDEQLNSCLKDEDYQNKLLELQIGAQEIFGVESTPTFLINGQKVAGNRPASEFIKIIKEKLNQ